MRDLAYYRLLTSTPAKHGELDRLVATDLDMFNCRAIIYRRHNDKTYQPYPLQLNKETVEALGHWLKHRHELASPAEIQQDIVFTDRKHSPHCVRGGIALGVRNHAIIQVLAASAARGGGIANLTIPNLRLNDGYATTYTKGSGGGYLKPQILYLDYDAVATIRQWMAIHPGCEALFPGVQKCSLTRDGVYQVIDNLATTANIEYSTKLHAWRHCWALEALRRGCDLNTVARILGIKPETVLKHYGRWANPEIQKRHQKYNWKNPDS